MVSLMKSQKNPAKVENHSVSAYYLRKWLVHFLTFTGAMFIFTAVRFLNKCKSKTGWLTSIEILWKWASKPTELAGDGESCNESDQKLSC